MDIDSTGIRESVRGQIKYQLNEGRTQALTEGMFQRLMAKGTDKYQFKFLEDSQQDTRYAFIKETGGAIHWHMFIGKRLMDSGVFTNDIEFLTFIDEKKSEGFKEVNRQGNIAGFFKTIGRGLGMLLTVHGFTALLGATIALIVIALNPEFIANVFGYGASEAFMSIYGTAAAGSLAVLSGGWVVSKLSEKQVRPDMDRIPDSEPVENPDAV